MTKWYNAYQDFLFFAWVSHVFLGCDVLQDATQSILERTPEIKFMRSRISVGVLGSPPSHAEPRPARLVVSPRDDSLVLSQ